ncbi:ThiF family adenylyltransferase [Gordonia aichiensis]|uniref:THIF-type NAD/FAD binding fold domain-containing protein n=1 Tax=Gordonia aichiensis NBRC 108223 TaxID=1220583 RepID=L7KPE5_9ACTN|nr:ThiF family adenylyltransferase [Gordonia aichiensis]GAC50381.1 hypothetical protein GOACH_24_00020 [Gordonia aichiensis NBRC 108223]
MIEILHPRYDRDRLTQLAAGHVRIVDTWPESVNEYLAMAALDSDLPAINGDNPDAHTRWIYFPWRATLVRLPDSDVFHRLRTGRNRYLITDAEQQRWAEATIAVAGLSVGASLLHTCVLTGCRRFRIADGDTLGPTNLNRLTGSVCDLGMKKSLLAHRRMLETDPYLSVDVFSSGVMPSTAREFVSGGEGVARADVVLEEVDDLPTKVELRRQARAAGAPLVMVTDDGDNVIVDVERYDLDPNYPAFHGSVGDIESWGEADLRDPRHRMWLVGSIVGDDISPRVSEAFAVVGRRIPSWPQLGTASTAAGAVGACVARRIVCGDAVLSGRARVRIDNLVFDAR